MKTLNEICAKSMMENPLFTEEFKKIAKERLQEYEHNELARKPYNTDRTDVIQELIEELE